MTGNLFCLLNLSRHSNEELSLKKVPSLEYIPKIAQNFQAMDIILSWYHIPYNKIVKNYLSPCFFKPFPRVNSILAITEDFGNLSSGKLVIVS